MRKKTLKKLLLRNNHNIFQVISNLVLSSKSETVFELKVVNEDHSKKIKLQLNIYSSFRKIHSQRFTALLKIISISKIDFSKVLITSDKKVLVYEQEGILYYTKLFINNSLLIRLINTNKYICLTRFL